MLKHKISTLTEAIDCYFDSALTEADPAVTINGNDESDLLASKNAFEHFLSSAFSDHGEDISNVEVDYEGSNATVNIILNDGVDSNALESLYQSKFDLAGSESGSFTVTDTLETEGGFTINVSLNDGTNDVLTGDDTIDDNSSFEDIEKVVDSEYTLEDLERITSGTGAEVVVDDFSLNGDSDSLVDLVNSKHFTSDDEVIEFIETSGEVDEMRNFFNDEDGIGESEVNHLSQTRIEEPITLKPIDVDLSSIDNIIGKYVKIGNFFHEVLGASQDEDDMYVISFAASTDGKQPGGEFEPGTIDEIGSLQLFSEDSKLEEQIEDEYEAFDADISDAIWEAIEKAGDHFDYTQDGFAGDYINTIFNQQDGRTVASIADSELEDMDKQQMVSYILSKIEEGLKYNAEHSIEDLDEDEDLKEASIKDGIAPFNKAWQEAKFLEAEMRFSKPDISKVRESVHVICDNLDELGDILKNVSDSRLAEQVVPASELGFKHQELAKIEDEVALISKLKAEDPGNELYTELLGCFDKAIEILKDSIGEEPVGTVVGKDDVSVSIEGSDDKLGGSEEVPIEEPIDNIEEEI